jgi:hypothetical protein
MLLLSAFAPSQAAASGGGAQAVEEGRRLALEARFDEALEAFERAAASTDLGREDLVALLEGRAMVHHGQRDEEAFARAARGLASIAPDYTPSRRIPPRLARRLRAAIEGVAPLSLEARGERSGEGVVVTSSVDNDAGDLVQRIVVAARVGDSTGFTDHEGERVSLEASENQGVRFYVRAVGPGGALLATVGSAESPEVMPVEELPPPAVLPREGTQTQSAVTATSTAPAQPFEDEPPAGDDDGLPIWPFIVGGVVIAAAIAAIAIALVVPGDNTSVGIPDHPL